MQVQIYSVRPFDVSVRKSFSLSGDPYRDSPAGKQAREYLMSLGVIFYRDEKNSPNGLVFQPADDDTSIITDRNGFDAWKYTVDLMEIGVREKKPLWPGVPATWKRPSPKIIDKNGDPLAWLHWNIRVHILRISDVEVLSDRVPEAV